MIVAGLNHRDLVWAMRTEDDCIAWLRANCLLAVSQQCPCCATAMKESPTSQHGKVWQCPTTDCCHCHSIRKGSFFDCSPLPLIKLVDFIYWWSVKMRNTYIESEVVISHVEIYQGLIIQAEAGYC